MRKRNIYIIIIIIIVLITTIFIGSKYKNFDINKRIIEYNLKEEKNEYIEYLKEYIYPQKLRNFIYNDYITFSQYNETATGHTIIKQMTYKAYEMLFESMFDKERVDFKDCPITEKFINKFNTNLFDYFSLKMRDDCKVNCLLSQEKREIEIEVFGNFKNTEPTSHKTYHFHYTLDNDGNVDNIELKNIEE